MREPGNKANRALGQIVSHAVVMEPLLYYLIGIESDVLGAEKLSKL